MSISVERNKSVIPEIRMWVRTKRFNRIEKLRERGKCQRELL
jgi:hypothetical protein